MAIVECDECGSKVSTTAKSCPHCGAKEYRSGFLNRVFVKLTWFVVEHAEKHLPPSIVGCIIWLMLALYVLFYLNIPFIVGYSLLLIEPSVDLPDLLVTWSNWVVDIYFGLYSSIYEFLKSKF